MKTSETDNSRVASSAKSHSVGFRLRNEVLTRLDHYAQLEDRPRSYMLKKLFLNGMQAYEREKGLSSE